MLVEVTQEDINMGVKKDCHRCPIARAISRTLGTIPDNISVIPNSVDIFHPKFLTSYFPDSVRVFIQNYDHNKSLVRPFEFELEGI